MFYSPNLLVKKNYLCIFDFHSINSEFRLKNWILLLGLFMGVKGQLVFPKNRF